METLYTTFQHIANILSYQSSENITDQLRKYSDSDWNTMVKTGSKHLVLPAIYCRLKQKQVLDLLPFELNKYLEELAQINRNRNTSLLKEAIAIQTLFIENQINHVFIKGIALIAGNYFSDSGERMIGDIDILVHKSHLSLAYELLVKNNYIPMSQTISSKYFKDKHLPRLVHPEKIGAVELHENLFNKKRKGKLNVNNILNQKRNTGKLSIPSSEHLLLHNVLNYQLNDHGYYYNSISIRPAYDSITILNKDSYLQIPVNSKYYSQYFHNLSVFFSDIQYPKNKYSTGLVLQFFKLKHQSPIIGKIWYSILNNYRHLTVLMHRGFFFLINHNYRKDLLKDYKRVQKILFK